MRYLALVTTLMFVPFLADAQTTGSLQGLISGLGGFIDRVLIPLVLAIAFLAFVWNVLRFFIIGADNEEAQQNAKTLAFYSVAAFVLFLSFWGIVKVISGGIGLVDADCKDAQSDYYRVNISAPCESIRPQPRPYEPVDGSDPDGLGNGGGDDNVPNIPGNDGQPNLPGNPSQPGTPSSTNSYDYRNVSDYANDVRLDSSAYFTSAMSETFGAHTNAVKNTLFADLPTTATPGYSDTDRSVAMYRLQELWVLPLSTVPEFNAQVNLYQTSLGFPFTPLTTASVKEIAERDVAYPASVINIMAENKEAIIETLSNFNAQNTPEILNAELYNPSLSPNTRMQNFKQYYTEGPEYDIFAADIETEKIFKGDFSPLP